MGLIHLEGIYDDPNGEIFRSEIYKRLRYHFQFRNQLMLFSEVGHRREYSINVYNGNKNTPNFYSINNLFHTSTIDGCFIHNGQGFSEVIKIKEGDDSENYIWNTKPHKDRIVHYNPSKLEILSLTFENSNAWETTKLVSIHSGSIVSVLEKLSYLNSSVVNYTDKITVCLDETGAVNNGIIKRHTDFPDFNNYQMIYSGPHFYVSNHYCPR